jgi:acetylglutamate kinase
MINSIKKFYRQTFRGELFIIKVSGKVVTDQASRENLIQNIHELIKDGIKVLLIYGGGEAIDKALQENGITSEKVNGRRITSEKDIKIIKKVMAGDLGFKITETLVKEKLPANVHNAIPPHWAIAKRRPKNNGNIRFDGVLDNFYPKAIKSHFSNTNLAVCPSLAFTKDGNALNINADNVAIELASKAKAAKLILMTNIDGVMVENEVQSLLSAREIETLIKNGIVTDGMQVKLENCVNALRAGVKRVHILNGLKKDALRNEIYTSTGFGTMIVRETEKKKYIKEEIQK